MGGIFIMCSDFCLIFLDQNPDLKQNPDLETQNFIEWVSNLDKSLFDMCTKSWETNPVLRNLDLGNSKGLTNPLQSLSFKRKIWWLARKSSLWEQPDGKFSPGHKGVFGRKADKCWQFDLRPYNYLSGRLRIYCHTNKELFDLARLKDKNSARTF